jgi:hypothetical protein
MGNIASFTATSILAACALSACTATRSVVEDSVDDRSFDGLRRVQQSRVDAAYIDPDADFSVFKRIAILDPHVAFRRNWRRDQNSSSRRNITTRDMERIQADVAALFKQVFTERLEADDGFEVVDVAGEDVLGLRPAIIDLDVTAPDTMTWQSHSRAVSMSDRARTTAGWVASSGGRVGPRQGLDSPRVGSQSRFHHSAPPAPATASEDRNRRG